MSEKQPENKTFSSWQSRLALLFSGMLLVGMAPALQNPTAFLKAVTIQESNGSMNQPVLIGKTLDIRRTLERIPYQATLTRVHTIEPERRYRQTILKGHGDCSQMTKGLAYALNEQGIHYEIVSILPRDKVLQGWGHTLLRLPYTLNNQRQVGLLDIYGGGLVVSNSRLADVEALRNDSPRQIDILPLHHPELQAPEVAYPAILKDSVIGYTGKAEIERQFKFLNTIYVPLGPAKMESHFYRFVTLVAGFYPVIQVASLTELFSPANLQLRLVYLACLWLIRISLAGWTVLALITALRSINRLSPPIIVSIKPESSR